MNSLEAAGICQMAARYGWSLRLLAERLGLRHSRNARNLLIELNLHKDWQRTSRERAHSRKAFQKYDLGLEGG